MTKPNEIKLLHSNETGNTQTQTQPQTQTQTQTNTQGYTYTPPVFSYFDCDNYVPTQTSKSFEEIKISN